MESISPRIVSLSFESNKVDSFLSEVSSITKNDINFVPFKRYLLSSHLINVFGKSFLDEILSILHDYDKGCLVIDFGSGLTESEYIKISTAVTHLINKPLPSDASGRHYGITRIEHTESTNFKLLEPYENFTLHTDGVFLNNPVDWLMMLKIDESNAQGGFSRLLHIDDWADYDFFYNSPNNIKYRHGLLEKDTRFDVFSKLISTTPSKSKILNKVHGMKNIKFVDQYVIPDDYIQAEFINNLQNSIETSSSVIEFPLPVGSAIILNNNFWMHGRSAFQRHENLNRVLLRQYGYFKDHHNYYDSINN